MAYPIVLSTRIISRSTRPELFLEKGVLKICSKFIGEHPCRSMISIKLLCNFIEITLWHGCSPVSLLHIFRTPFSRNTSGWLLLYFWSQSGLSESSKYITNAWSHHQTHKHKSPLKRNLIKNGIWAKMQD